MQSLTSAMRGGVSWQRLQDDLCRLQQALDVSLFDLLVVGPRIPHLPSPFDHTQKANDLMINGAFLDH